MRERIEREYDLDVILTSPNVKYEVVTRKDEVLSIENPSKFPDAGDIKEARSS